MQERKGRRLLVVLAHPDDETFGCGGVLARYAAEGVRVSLICATRGEAGEIRDPSLATRGNLAQVRERELRAACEVLGVEDLYVFGYRDSGMKGAPDNQHPEALCQARPSEVAGKIVEIIRSLGPQVVVTFDPTGGYGHPDHIAIHNAAVEAFGAAGDASRFPEQLGDGLEPHRPRKLYYAAFPRSLAREFRDAVRAAGIDSDFGDMDPEQMGVPDEQITTVVDVGKYGGRKEQAARCHRTQVQGDDPFSWVPGGLRERFMTTEHLVRAAPAFVGSGGTLEEDLFGDITD